MFCNLIELIYALYSCTLLLDFNHVQNYDSNGSWSND